jgi:periplasmic divalent cation tolerance protein
LRAALPVRILAIPAQPLGTVTLNNHATAHLVALTTAPSEAEARRIVTALVQQRVIACGTILPAATSIYRWKGAIEEAAEVVVLLKTRAERWDQLRAQLAELHPYEVPELIALPVTGGHGPYLDWLQAET